MLLQVDHLEVTQNSQLKNDTFRLYSQLLQRDFVNCRKAIQLTWRNYIHTVENKIAKDIGLLYQGKHYLDENYLKQIYFAYIHAYLNYVNIAWASTNKT